MTDADIRRMKEEQALRALETLGTKLGDLRLVAWRFDSIWCAEVDDGRKPVARSRGFTLLEVFAQLAQTLEAQ